MSDSPLFYGAALPWLRRVDADGAREIFDRLDSSLRLADRELEVIVRPNYVYTPRRELVMAAAEPLTRWDSREPTEIFRTGFQPRLTPGSLAEFRSLNNMQVNILNYVVDNIASIFVSATRYVMREGGLERWSPALTRGRYEYEIFAYGGIDINLSLRPRYNLFAHQQEITFPGGIRPGLIRSARQYDDRGRVIRVWRNLHFNPLLNRENTPRTIDLPPLPDIVDTANFYMTDPPDEDDESTNHPGHDELRRRREVTQNNDDDSMKDYKLITDPWAASNVHTFPLPRACMMLSKSGKHQAFFFSDSRFVPINIVPNDMMTDTVGEGGVQNLIKAWPALHKAQFSQVDAVLPNPNNDEEAYFFCKDKYVLIKLDRKEIVNGPKTIVNEWPSLREAGFPTVDAILPNYDNNGEAYVFHGTDYVRIKIKPGTNDDYIIGKRRKIVEGWGVLKEAGFDSVDAILPSPRTKGETYFFKGDRYVLVKVVWGTSDDKLMFQPRRVAEYWSSLVQAKFY